MYKINVNVIVVRCHKIEHGVHGNLQAGEAVSATRNEQLGIPEYSLFGETPRLTAEMLRGLDLMLFDIQDIGARFYTYIYTLGQAMEDCARAGRVRAAVPSRAAPAMWR